MPILECNNLTKTYAGVTALDHIDLAIDPGRIVTGRYLPGEKLPSVRELAAEAGINPNTVQRAFSELEREGLIYTQRATGKYVTENEADIKSAREALARTQVADFLRAMQSLGFSVGDVIVLLQSFNESKEEIKHADSGM